MGKYIEIKHHFVNDALADTIMERNEAVYVKIIELRKQLGGSIESLTVSNSFWKDNFEQTWLGTVFTSVPIPEHLDGRIKVATFHAAKEGDPLRPVYTSDWYDDARDWLLVSCSEGQGRIIIEGFR